jgi:release factor glutamine methyltransferase
MKSIKVWQRIGDCLGYLYGMHTLGKAFYDLKNELLALYDEREAAAIAHELLSEITGLSKVERLLQREEQLTAHQEARYKRACIELLTGRPLQYVVGYAWFMGQKFIVNERVLIPRPETEELVQWVISDHSMDERQARILDIGTGSGCIPISLKLAMPGSTVSGCDISAGALDIAAENADNLDAEIRLLQTDILDNGQWEQLGRYDIIVSNPPYIPDTERERIHANVKDHEPAVALFVPGNEALLFYHAIADFGAKHLAGSGYIYCELDASHAFETKRLFEDAGYRDVEVREDMHGNWRMLKARLKGSAVAKAMADEVKG